jgi:hypothetical protein
MRAWLADLIAGPDGRVDEAALFICALGLMTIGSWVIMNALISFVVLSRGEHFSMVDFASANAVLLGAAGTTAGIITAFIGTRNKCTH